MKSMRLEILEILSQKTKDHLNRKNYRSLLLCDIQSCVLQSNFHRNYFRKDLLSNIILKILREEKDSDSSSELFLLFKCCCVLLLSKHDNFN